MAKDETQLGDAGAAPDGTDTGASAGGGEGSTVLEASVETPHERAAREWLYGELSNSPLSRNQECWEVVHAALPALARRLAAVQPE